MFISRKLVLVIGMVFLALLVVMVFISIKQKPTVRTLTLEDLPEGVIHVAHVHPEAEVARDENGQPIGEMHHYAMPEAVKNSGPIYGVYGYRIVSVEYEIPESKIGLRMVGKEFPGWGLASSFFGFINSVPPYDHFHVGLKDKQKTSAATGKTYRIHFMFLSHDEELKIGLSCG
ncbi:MAG: hypothetical protein Q7R69_00550 [bacterium]|nr:hypothetical protein [bacterium]